MGSLIGGEGYRDTNLIVKIAMDGHTWLSLPSKESVMQFLVIDVHATYFRSHLFSHFLFQRLISVLENRYNERI